MAPKTIIVTGASRGDDCNTLIYLKSLDLPVITGIGLAIAQFLLKAPQSSNVIVIARSKSPLERLQEEYPSQVQFLAGDLSDFSLAKDAIELAVSKWGQLDGLVLNHGVLEPVKRVTDVEIQDWKNAFDTNFFSVIAFVSAPDPYLH